tara:strand:- start:305 stop:511 length:207 start_codon:yes stop_codon:yes gene_type:complete
MKPVGTLIDDIINKTQNRDLNNKDVNGFIKRYERNGGKLPYHLRFNKVIACIRILRGRGMVVYYKEDE